VEAVDTSGNVSAMSTIAVGRTLAFPSPPTNLVATPTSTKQIKLSWSPGPSGMKVAFYYVCHGNSPSTLNKVATVGKTSFTDYALTSATIYYYAVQEGYTGFNLSPLSARISATTPAH